MPLPEGYTPRKGDILVVHMAVDYVGETLLKLKAVHPDDKWTEGHYFKPEIIVAVKRRTWEVDERVRSRNEPQQVGTVVSMHDDFVWVALDGVNGPKGHRTFHCNEIEPLLPPATVDVLHEEGKVEKAYPIQEHPGIAPRPRETGTEMEARHIAEMSPEDRARNDEVEVDIGLSRVEAERGEPL